MIYDICIGIIAYVGASIFFGEPFQIDYFLLAFLFAFLPDFDFIPYLLLRKKWNLVTHWFIHFPLPFALLGIVIGLFSPYIGTLFFVCTLGHIIHDLFSETAENYPQGIRWLYPFSKTSLSWQGKRFVLLQEVDQKKQLELRRIAWQTAEKRSIWWEIRTRMESISFVGWVAVLVSFVLLIWFIKFSSGA